MNESWPVLQQVGRCLLHTCMSRATYESGFRVLSFSPSLTCARTHSLYAHCTPQVAEALDKETYDLIFKAPVVRSKGAATRSVGRPRGATRGGGGGRGGGQSQEKQTINAVVEDMHRFCDTSGFWTSAWVLQVLYIFTDIRGRVYLCVCMHVSMIHVEDMHDFRNLRGFWTSDWGLHILCLYIYVRVCLIHMCLYICAFVCGWVCVGLCMWVYVCVSVYVCVYMRWRMDGVGDTH